ncbi:MAG: diacylglycerol kinase [Legionella longbeachae]|nr:diacylglycerol kinase [Legionella longbeachae]
MRQYLVKPILKIKNATYYSLSGLKAAFQDEFAFRLEVLIFIFALPAAFFLGNTPIERALLISTLFLIFIAELLNSAIENTLNRIDRNWNPLIKKAKDQGSAAVMIAIINALIVWSFIIIPHFWRS